MNDTAGVWWQEGLFLQPEHFQQESRSHGRYVRDALMQLGGGMHGFTRLVTDESLLAAGKLTVLQAKGVMPDGTPFELTSPLSTDFHGLSGDVTFCLALPLAGAPDRFVAQPLTVTDTCTPGEREPLAMSVAALNLRLKSAAQCRDDEICLAVAKFRCAGGSGSLPAEPDFCAVYLYAQDNPWLRPQMDDLLLLLQHRLQRLCDALGQLRKQAGYQTDGSREMAFWQMMPYCTLLQGWTLGDRVTTREFYRFCQQLQTMLCALAFTWPPPPQPWQDEDHFRLLSPCLQALKQRLTPAGHQQVQTLTWDTRLLAPRRLLRVSLPAEALAGNTRLILEYEDDSGAPPDPGLIIRLLKLAGNSQIAACVNNGVTGIPLTPLAVPPGEILRRPQAVYFEPDKRSPLWQRMVQQDNVLALHIDGQLVNFRLNAYLINRR